MPQLITVLSPIVLSMYFLLASAGSAISQNDALVSTGVSAYYAGKYDDALSSLDEALSDESLLTHQIIPKAYYFRAKTRMAMITAAYSEEDEETMTLYPEYTLSSFQDMMTALGKDVDAEWESKIKADLFMIYTAAVQFGLVNLNESRNTQGPPEKTELQQTSMQFLLMVLKIDEVLGQENYLPYDLMGQLNIEQGKYDQAANNLSQAIELYDGNPPQIPDLLISYAYYRLSFIHRYYLSDLSKSYSYIAEGQAELESEYARLELIKSKHTNEEWSKIRDQYLAAKSDLFLFELDIYMSDPNKLQEATEKFSDAVARYPDNYSIHIGYAGILEKINRQKAIEVYKIAIEIDPGNDLAFYNLGALYNNMAMDAIDAAPDDMDNDLANKYMLNALNYFKKAFEVAPAQETVRAIMTIVLYLGLDEEYDRYRKTADELFGEG